MVNFFLPDKVAITHNIDPTDTESNLTRGERIGPTDMKSNFTRE